jgi:hypothetical protein
MSAVVDAAAKQMWSQALIGPDWDVLPGATKDHWRRTAGPIVEAALAAHNAPVAKHEQEVRAAWSDSDRRDVAAWLIREADQRVKFFPQRHDGVDALVRHLAALARADALTEGSDS